MGIPAKSRKKIRKQTRCRPRVTNAIQNQQVFVGHEGFFFLSSSAEATWLIPKRVGAIADDEL